MKAKEKEKTDAKGIKGFSVKLYLLAALVVFAIGILDNRPIEILLVHCVIVWLLVMIVQLVLCGNDGEYYHRLVRPKMFMAGYAIACVMMVLAYFTNTFNLWLLGAVFIAVASGFESALFLHVILCVIYSVCFSLSIMEFAYYVVIGSVLCIMCSRLHKWLSLCYAIVIGICIDLSLQFVLHDFDVAKVFCRYSLFSVVSTVGVIVIAFLIDVMLGNNEQPEEADVLEEETETEEQETEEQETEEQKTDERDILSDKLDIILNQEYELLISLQQHSKNLYMHSVDIGEISYMAAESIGGNAKLAKAGGLYHEIGKIKGDNNYIENGEQLAKEADFPDEVIAIIRQHNAKYEAPETIEAAIVMLTDSVVTTLEYLESIGKKDSIPSEKLINNVFENRLNKGNLDACSLTVAQYKTLMKFYVDNAF